MGCSRKSLSSVHLGRWKEWTVKWEESTNFNLLPTFWSHMKEVERIFSKGHTPTSNYLQCKIMKSISAKGIHMPEKTPVTNMPPKPHAWAQQLTAFHFKKIELAVTVARPTETNPTAACIGRGSAGHTHNGSQFLLGAEIMAVTAVQPLPSRAISGGHFFLLWNVQCTIFHPKECRPGLVFTASNMQKGPEVKNIETSYQVYRWQFLQQEQGEPPKPVQAYKAVASKSTEWMVWLSLHAHALTFLARTHNFAPTHLYALILLLPLTHALMGKKFPKPCFQLHNKTAWKRATRAQNKTPWKGATARQVSACKKGAWWVRTRKVSVQDVLERWCVLEKGELILKVTSCLVGKSLHAHKISEEKGKNSFLRHAAKAE